MGKQVGKKVRKEVGKELGNELGKQVGKELGKDVRMEVVETIVEYMVIGRKIGSTELRRSGAVSVRIGDLLVPRALFLKRGSEWGMETLKRLMGCGGEVDEYVNRISKHMTFLRDNEKEQNDDRT